MIVTLNELKQYLNLKTAVTTNDTVLTSFITQSQSEIKDYLRFEPESGTRTIYFNSNSGLYYQINDVNITAITSLAYRNLPTESYTTVSSSLYATQQISGLTWLYCSNGFAYDINRLIYVGGYTTIPDTIKAVCLEKAAIKYKNSGIGESNLGLQQRGENVASTSMTTIYKELQNKWNTMLDPYRLLLQ